MKNTLTILISSLLLCGCCTQRQASQPFPAIDRIQSETDTAWDQGAYVLHVTTRHGDAVEGVRLISKSSEGIETVVSADTGTISLGPSCVDGVTDDHAVKLTLDHPVSVTETKREEFTKWFRVLHW